MQVTYVCMQFMFVHAAGACMRVCMHACMPCNVMRRMHAHMDACIACMHVCMHANTGMQCIVVRYKAMRRNVIQCNVMPSCMR